MSDYDLANRSYVQAIEAIDEYLKSDSQNKEALELKIKLLMRVQRFSLAKQLAKRCLMLGGEESKYLELYGDASLQSGDFEGAEHIYARAYKLDPDSSYHFGQKYKLCKELNKIKKEGNDLVSRQKIEEAIVAYSKGLEACQKQELACGYVFLNNRSACYMNSKRYQEALADIDASLQLYPYFFKPYLRRIQCVKQLQLSERMSTIPSDYLNALYTMGFKDKAVSAEYLSFLRQNRVFKTNVNPISNTQDLDRVISINPDTLIVLDIYASWCVPCKMLAPILDDLSVTHPTVIFLKVDADKTREVSTMFHVDAFPTIVLLKGGKTLDRIVGYDPDKLEMMINDHMGLEVDMKGVNWFCLLILIL